MFNYAVLILKDNDEKTTELNVVAENVKQVVNYCSNLNYEIVEVQRLNKVDIVITNG